MTSRDRIKAAVNFQPPDRLPISELFWEGTLQRWRGQEMPAEVSAEDFFGLDLCTMFLDASPRFQQRVVREEGQFTVYEDRFGYTIRRPTGISGSLQFLDHVIKEPADWPRVKKGFVLSDDPTEPARIDELSYFAHMDPYPSWHEAAAKYRRLRDTGRYLVFRAYGPWNATWRHRGMEPLMMDLATEPDWVREMAETYQDLVIAILEKCLSLAMRPDGFFMFEDLGWRKSMLISPASWRDVLKPGVARLGTFLRDNGIDFWVHSDGAIVPVIDDLIECGVRVLNPLEVAAGLDVRELRARYGKRLAFYGNISVKNIIHPDERPLVEEIRVKVPLARDGGYVFGSDHSIPHEVDLARYQRMLAVARESFADGQAADWPSRRHTSVLGMNASNAG